ncbi:MAG TPA: nucleoside deaminase [Bacteroidales bacterium]|nr:nucleoside deaminase [Bacteroidales bacterium]HPS49286.1 nucleoside deaminase [Bacteroidales bacterium]
MTQVRSYPLFSPEFFMNEALKEAKKAFEKDEVPVGAVVVCNRTIIARAHNLTETLKDVTAHAEMQAFTAAANFLGGKYLNECELYVTLEPCLMCAAASHWAQLGTLYYGASDDKRGFTLTGTRVLHPKTVVNKGILEDECGSIIRLFFKNKRGAT